MQARTGMCVFGIHTCILQSMVLKNCPMMKLAKKLKNTLMPCTQTAGHAQHLIQGRAETTHSQQDGDTCALLAFSVGGAGITCPVVRVWSGCISLGTCTGSARSLPCFGMPQSQHAGLISVSWRPVLGHADGRVGTCATQLIARSPSWQPDAVSL